MLHQRARMKRRLVPPHRHIFRPLSVPSKREPLCTVASCFPHGTPVVFAHLTFCDSPVSANPHCCVCALFLDAWWAEQGAYDCKLTRSTLTDLGGGAVRIGRGHAVDATAKAECEGHTITDNIMLDGGHVCQEGCGVLAQNIGNSTISHNTIGHFKYTGISTGWTWG